MLDRDNEQSKSCPAQLDMGPQVLGRVPQGISLYLLLSGQSFLLSDLHPLCFSGNHAPFISSKLSPFPTSLAWMSEESQEKVLPPPHLQILLQRLGRAPRSEIPLHPLFPNLQEGRKREGIAELLLPWPPSLRRCPQIPSPISLLPGAAPPVPSSPPPQVPTPRAHRSCPRDRVAQKAWSPRGT